MFTSGLSSIHPLHVGITEDSSGEACEAPEGWVGSGPVDRADKTVGRGGVGFGFFNKFSRPTLSGPLLAPYSFSF